MVVISYAAIAKNSKVNAKRNILRWRCKKKGYSFIVRNIIFNITAQQLGGKLFRRRWTDKIQV